MNHRSVRNGTPLRHDTPNIATEMRKSGYLPMLFGYTDTSADPRAHHPHDPILKSYEHPMTGFHEVLEMRLEESYPWRAHLMQKGYAFEEYWDVHSPTSPTGGPPRLNDPALYRAEDSDTAFLTDTFINSMVPFAGQKWFAHLTYIRPHPPLVAPAPYNEMYDGSTLPLPSGYPDQVDELALHPFFGPTIDKQTPSDFVVGFDNVEPTAENVQTLRAVYLGLATEVDHHIGRVVQFLKDSGQYEDTLVVITADHGEMLGDRHCWGKMTVFDAAYHTPLIIRVPGNQAQAGSVVTVPTESIDITPTILDWVGQPIPNAMDGRSLKPFLEGQAPDDWRQYSFSELDFSDLTLWKMSRSRVGRLIFQRVRTWTPAATFSTIATTSSGRRKYRYKVLTGRVRLRVRHHSAGLPRERGRHPARGAVIRSCPLVRIGAAEDRHFRSGAQDESFGMSGSPWSSSPQTLPPILLPETTIDKEKWKMSPNTPKTRRTWPA